MYESKISESILSKKKLYILSSSTFFHIFSLRLVTLNIPLCVILWCNLICRLFISGMELWRSGSTDIRRTIEKRRQEKRAPRAASPMTAQTPPRGENVNAWQDRSNSRKGRCTVVKEAVGSPIEATESTLCTFCNLLNFAQAGEI